MGSQDLRRVCEQRVRELELPVSSPFRPEQWCEALAQRRGKPITIALISSGRDGYACGVWVATAAMDIILVEKAATPQHQDHIIAHELGHMVFDHYGVVEPSHALLSELLPNLNPTLVQRVLGRNAYTEREEQEAEVFASVLMIGVPRTDAVGGVAEEQVSRFASALEPGGQWHG